MRVSSADFRQKFGSIAEKAMTEPVTITREGRGELVLLSAAEYDRLKRRDRRVVRLEGFTEDEIALIAKAEVPAEYGHLDAELKDWRP
jgi:prevent-host-death family protein